MDYTPACDDAPAYSGTLRLLTDSLGGPLGVGLLTDGLADIVGEETVMSGNSRDSSPKTTAANTCSGPRTVLKTCTPKYSIQHCSSANSYRSSFSMPKGGRWPRVVVPVPRDSRMLGFRSGRWVQGR